MIWMVASPAPVNSPLLLLVATFRAIALRPRAFFKTLDTEEWFPAFDYALIAAALQSALITLFWNMGKFYLSPKAPLMALAYFALNLLVGLWAIKLTAGFINRVCAFFSGVNNPRFAYQATAYVYGLFAFWPITFGLSAIYGYLIYMDTLRRFYDLSVLEVLVAWLLAMLMLAVFFFFVGICVWIPFSFAMTILGIVPSG